MISYYVASEVYEFSDMGISIDDMVKYFGKEREFVKTILERRKIYEPKIVKNLRLMFKDESIETPYVPDKLRVGYE